MDSMQGQQTIRLADEFLHELVHELDHEDLVGITLGGSYVRGTATCIGYLAHPFLKLTACSPTSLLFFIVICDSIRKKVPTRKNIHLLATYTKGCSATISIMAGCTLMSFVQVADFDFACKVSPNIFDNKQGFAKYV